MSTAIDKNLQPVMKGRMTLDAGVKQLQDAVNKLLRQGKAQIG